MAAVVRAGGRDFPAEVIEAIREAMREDETLTRTALSRRVCEWLSWQQPNGRLREVSCRVALQALEQRGVIQLPASRTMGGRQGELASGAPTEYLVEPPQVELPITLRKLGRIELLVVGPSCRQEYRQWKEVLERFHPQGHHALPQAHVRYLIRCSHGILGALCFSAAARHLAARDGHIGWSSRARAANRELVVANSRFLLLPWVRVPDLASHVLAQAARRLPQDWHQACGLRPVLLETYVDTSRHRATCYRAAGWERVGETTGRTRNDRTHTKNGPVRAIYLLPLCDDYKQRLGSEPIVRKAGDQQANPTASWARRELGGADLGDPRRAERLVNVLESFYAKPNASVPKACHRSWGELKGAYRLLGNDKIAMSDILAPHYASTAERMGNEAVVLAVQDTTSLNYGAHPATTGLGPISSQADGALGLEVHDTLAFTPDGVPLGLLHVQVWARDPKEFGKKHTRRKRSINDKESYKWLESFQAAAHAQRLCPHSRVVSVGDRESDIYDLFDLALSRDDHPALLVRASVDRNVNGVGGGGRLWSVVESQEEAGVRHVEVPRTATRRARRARLSVRFCEVELRPPRNGPRCRRVLRAWAILAREQDAPGGVEPLEWMLLTTIEVRDLDDALEKIDWYVRRWGIEVYHHTLKSGCLIEERQFGSATGLTNCLAVDMIVAWRILYMTRLGRAVPDLPCTAVFTQDEWQSLYTVSHPKKPLPHQPPSLNEVIRMVANLGGYIGRKSDGPPGVEALWVGLGRLFDIEMCWRLFRPPAQGP